MSLLADASQWLGGFAQRFPELTAPIIVITAIAIFSQPLVLAWLWFERRELTPIVAALASVVVSTAVCRVVADFQFHPRPFVALHFSPLFPHSANTSFPSSTTAMAFAAALGVWLYRRNIGRWLLAASLFVGFGCVYVGVHWLTDVMVGGVIGVGSALLVWCTLKVPAIGRMLAAFDVTLRGLHLRPKAD